MNQTLAKTLNVALNNPDCAITTGMVLGAIFIIKWIFAIYIAIWALSQITKAIDNLAINPLIKYLKKKIYKR